MEIPKGVESDDSTPFLPVQAEKHTTHGGKI